MKRQLLLSAATALLLSVPAIATAQQPAPAPTTQQSPSFQSGPAQAGPWESDQKFAEKAAISDLFEIQAGQLATEKAKNADVKTLGKQMVEDHGKTSGEMKTLAQAKKMTLPTKLDAEHQQKLETLRGLSGDAFDSAYVQGQLDAHRTAVALFDAQIKQGQDAELKTFAQKTLPALQQHLKHVQDLLPRVASAAPGGGQHGMQASSVVPGDTLAAAGAGAGANQPTPSQLQTMGAGGQTSFTALMGADVYGENGNKLGDVADVILDPQSGAATAVILNRGGVLGIGAKRVALDYALLDQGSGRLVARDLTEDQVKAMPEFQYEDTTVSLGDRKAGSTTGETPRGKQ